MPSYFARLLRRVSIPFLLLASAAGVRAQAGWPLWNAYAHRFIDVDGRVIDFHADDHSTSEGQSYALFFALVQNDRPRFERVLAWTQDNLAGGDLNAHLPGWLWGKSKEGKWGLLDAGSASDSDCWIAYDLLEAGRLWNEPQYTKTALNMLHMIAVQEVADLPGFGRMVMPGLAANWVHNRVWTVNSCYLPSFLFERFAVVDPAGPWHAIADNIPLLLAESNRRGFAMDWSAYRPGHGFIPAPPPGPPPAPPKPGAPANHGSAAGDEEVGARQPLQTPAGGPQAPHFVPVPMAPRPGAAKPPAPKPAVGSYDAIRVYLWAGMLDPAAYGRANILDSLAGMSAYLADHGAPPEKVDSDGSPMAQDGPVGFSAAVLPYLKAVPDGGKAFSQQQARMAAQFDARTGLYGEDPAYYDQNLTLFATGYLDGRFRFSARGELMVEWNRE